MYGVLLILIVVVISGIIAYLGDQIGMKVGKKRISVFGLRPKHTSILITVLTGVLIASLTITTILATNNGVRQAIFNIQEVLSTLNNLRTELDDVNQQLLLKDDELTLMHDNIAARELELDFLQEIKDDLANENDILEGQKDELEFELGKLNNELQTAQANIDELQTTKDHLEAQLTELNQLVNNLSYERKELEEEIEQLNLLTRNLSNIALNSYLKDLVYHKGEIIYLDVIKNGSIQEVRDSVHDFIMKANKEVLKQPVLVLDQEAELAINLRNPSEDIMALVANIVQSDRERFIVSMTSDVYVSENNPVYAKLHLNESYIVFEENQMITKGVVDANSTPLELELELRTLLDEVNKIAVRNGILTNEDGFIDTIEFIMFYQIMTDIQAMDGDVEVRVIANEAIWREDGWNREFAQKISFEVEKVGEIHE
ncbi:DUF3084 domain-containing protein [Natronospora cellulosivora (SeqCode)]